MALENAAREPQSTWFLRARSGNLLLRLRSTLHIGEDESGDLVLAPAPGEALLTITVGEDNLQLKCAQSGWLLSDDALDNAPAGSQSLTLTPGDTVALSLPNNQFTLTGDSVQYLPITRQLRLMVEPEIPTLEIQVEPALVAMAVESLGPMPADTPAPEPSSEPEVFLEPILIQEAAYLPVRKELTETVTTIDQPQPHPAAATASKRVFPTNRTALAVMIAGLVFTLYFAADSQRSETIEETVRPAQASAFPDEQTLQLLGSSASTVVEEPVQTTPAEPTTAALPMELDSLTPPDIEPTVSAQSSAPPVLTPAAADLDPELQQALETQLAEAERLMAQGMIIDPRGSNAIKILIAVLNTDPTNERGLALIYECAMQLLDQARAANAAGDEFLARNLTEEVLAFHPTLPDALELRSQLWSQ